jgi:hypothetical protein
MEQQQQKIYLNKKVPIKYIQNISSKINILRESSESVFPPPHKYGP